ncbi:MAG TPA: tetratricopeptide repeat protein [Pirellulales bacterium]|nr:tetratricopeptide repeat protein [Pirellulales bacterium]
MTTDHNLLFGVLAFQLDFIDRRALLAAFNRWTADKNRPLGEILVELGDLDASQRQLLDALVAEHVIQHGGDAKRSLAAVSSLGSVRKDLKRIADPDLQVSLAGTATLVHHAPACDDLDPHATVPPLAGKSYAAAGSRFRILRPHARGGLGEVYVAQDEELHREVALKEIQERHADNPASRSRFVLEAEITGGLEHPGIVPVYGLGSYADGRPFYAMRFIKGDSLGEAIERFHGNRLQVKGNRDQEGDTSGGASAHPSSLTTHHSTIHSFTSLEFRKLLGRFIDVCNAIEYAHSRGVLHRDLKPGNIMLGNYGETLVVDWGLAKVVGHGETRDAGDERTLRPASASGSAPTLMGSAIGTPQYMSPEQAEGRLDQLGPASDVYSLGATLYTLLTGRAAFEAGDLAALLRSVVRGEFRPPRQVNRHVPRALDAICLKGMALKPADRYPSPRALADDVEHWLADEPVSALPESAAQRLGRWLRRHRAWAQSAAAALLLVTLVSLVAVVFVNAARQATATALVAETRAKEDATKAAAAERAANETAQRRLTQIEKGNDVLGSIFEDLDPQEPEREGTSLQSILGERLDRATEQLEGEAVGDPLVVAKLQTRLGMSHLGLANPAKAIVLLARARETYTALLGPEHPDTLTSIGNLGLAHRAAAEFDQAIALLEAALKLQKAGLGPEHSTTIRTMNNLALAYLDTGKLDQALPLLEAAFKLQRAEFGPEHPDTVQAGENLANTYRASGALDQALPLFEDTLKLRTTQVGANHPKTLRAMSNLALAYCDAGKLDQALPLLEGSLKFLKVKLGPDHPETLIVKNNLAGAYRATGQLAAALPMLEEVLEMLKAKLGADHPNTLTGMNNLASAYQDAGKLDKALPLFEETLKLRRGKLGPEHPDTLATANNLALAYHGAGKLDMALPLLEKTLELLKAKLGPEHPLTLTAMNNLASAYKAGGKLEAALPLCEETLKLRKAVSGADHPDTLTAMNNLATAYQDAGKLDEALPLFEETLRLGKRKLGPEHPDTLATANNLAVAYRAAGKLEAALPLFEEVLELLKAKLGADHPNTLSGMNNLASAYQDAGKLDQALPLLEQTLKLRKGKLGPEHPHTLITIGNLAAAYGDARRFADADALFQDLLAAQRRKLPAGHPALAGPLAQLGGNLLKAEQPARAEPFLRECLDIRQRSQPDHWTTFNARSMLGGALLGQEKYADAEPLLVAGYQGMNDREAAIPPQGKIRLTEALGRLVALYEGWEKPEEAATWREKLQAAQKASMDEPR